MAEQETLHLKVRGVERTYCLLPAGETDNTDLHYLEDVNCQTCKDGFAEYFFRVRSMPRSDLRTWVDALEGAGFALLGMAIVLGGLLIFDMLQGHFLVSVLPAIGGVAAWVVSYTIQQKQKRRWAEWSRQQREILTEGRVRTLQEAGYLEGPDAGSAV